MQQSLRASLVRSLVGVIAAMLLIVLSLGTAGCAPTHPQAKPPEPAQIRNLEDNDRPGSLRYAIETAPAGGTITFDTKLRGTLLLTSNLYIAKELTIRGPGAGMVSISSGKSGYSVYVVQHSIVAISGLTFKDSNTSSGFINNQGTLTLTSSVVSGNTATDDGAGGAITNSGTLTLSNSTISGNTTGGNSASAGISNQSGGTLTLTNSTVSDNLAGPNSTGVGGIFNNGTLTISNSTISGNKSNFLGGIDNDNNGKLTISKSTVSDNAPGGIASSGALTISNSTISDNNGSGIFNFNATLTLTNSTVSGNTNFCGGGGIDNNGTLIISNSTISDNTAPNQVLHPGENSCGPNVGDGGGILNERQAILMMSNSTVSGNTAQTFGGGIFNEAQGTLVISSSTISGNTADGGGGISNFGTLTLSNSTISGNSAKAGGGISIQSSINPDSTRTIAHADLIFSTMYSNTAHSGGDIAIEDFAYSDVSSKAITQISQVKIGNSIVAGDPAHPGPDIVGTLTSSGYNLFQATSGATFDPATSKQHGTDRALSANDLSSVFAASGGLQHNGGSTMTYALAPGSPAIDAIPLQYCQIKDIFNSQLGMYTDQRGVKRADGNEQFCDIGAYESD